MARRRGATFHDLGYVTYDVIASGTLEADIDALGRAVAAVLGSANVLGDTSGAARPGAGPPSLCTSRRWTAASGRSSSSRAMPRSRPSFRLARAYPRTSRCG
jgi:D-serine deaminase-like pyridoxal phosphate-dependent protein